MQKLKSILLGSLFVILSLGSTAQSPGTLLHKADSLTRIGQVHLSDSICNKLIQNSASSTLIQFKSFTQLADNRLIFFQFKEAKKFISQAELRYNKIASSESKTLAKYHFLLGNFYHFTNQYDRSFQNYEKAQKFLEKEASQWKLLAQLYLRRAQAQSRRNEVGFHKIYIDKASEILLSHEPDFELLGDMRTQLSRYYRIMGEWEKCIKTTEESIEDYTKAFGPLHVKISMAIQYQHFYYEQRGDLNTTLECLQKARTVLDQLYPRHPARMGQNASLISNCYRRLGRYEEAHQYINDAITQLIAHIGHDRTPVIGDMYRRKAQIYEAQDSIDLAIQYFKKSTSTYQKNQNNRDKSNNIQGLTRSFLAKGELDSARYWNQKDFNTLIPIFGPDVNLLSETYRIAGLIDILAHNPKKGIAKFQLALEKAAPSFKAFSWEDLPDAQQFEFIPPVLSTLKSKAQTLQMLATTEADKQKYLQAAYDTYLLGIELIDLLRSSYQEEDTKQIIQENGAEIYRGAVSTLIDLYQNKEDSLPSSALFKLINQSKALLLREALMDKKAKIFAGIPDSLIKLENSLRSNISSLRFNTNNNQSPLAFRQNQKELLNLKEQHDELIQYIERQYPRYFELKYARPNIKTQEIQHKLKDQQALIQYYISDQHLISFIFTSKGHQLLIKALPNGLNDQISDFRKALKDLTFIRNHKEQADQLIANEGYFLFENLLKEELKSLPEKVNELIIIPDGVLAYLPFSQLLTEEVELPINYSKLPYIFRDYAISYAYSSSLWANQKANHLNYNKRKTLASFAPSYGNSKKEVDDVLSMLRGEALADLPGAKKEAIQIAKLFKGKAWLGKEATEANFKAIKNEYNIFHFSMHGILDDQNPLRSHLAFQQEDPTLIDHLNDNYLLMAELYGMELNADMVVLSACNSGSGKLNQAEGIMSLARAFSYSGARSIVMSLWSVPDQSTSDLMISFYQNLKKGQSKNIALQKAKLEYLDKTRDPLFSHPYFWSAFVIIGETNPVSNRSYFPALVLVSALGLGVFLFYQYSGKKKKETVQG